MPYRKSLGYTSTYSGSDRFRQLRTSAKFGGKRIGMPVAILVPCEGTRQEGVPIFDMI